MGQCSAWLTSLPLVLKPSITRCTNAQLSPGHLHCSLYALRHNIYSCTWPVCIALFQINDPTMYLLGFYSFSVLQPKLQLYPNFWLGHVVEPFMEVLDCQHCAGLATRATPDPSVSAGTLLQVTTKEPLVPQHLWVSHPVASYAPGGL